jgi:hypothetical protein
MADNIAKTSCFWDQYYIAHQRGSMDLCVVIASFAMNLFGKTRIRRILFKNRSLK